MIYITNNKHFIEPTSGFFCDLLSYPALRTGLFILNHIRGFEEKILKGFNLNNHGCKPVVNRTM